MSTEFESSKLPGNDTEHLPNKKGCGCLVFILMILAFCFFAHFWYFFLGFFLAYLFFC